MFMKLITLKVTEFKRINQIRSKLQVCSLGVLPEEEPCYIHLCIPRSLSLLVCISFLLMSLASVVWSLCFSFLFFHGKACVTKCLFNNSLLNDQIVSIHFYFCFKKESVQLYNRVLFPTNL